MLELKPLPYDYAALEPHISRETLELHHGKHHRAYVDRANALLTGKPVAAGLPALEILRFALQDGDQALANNVGQVINHDAFWRSMSPDETEIGDESRTRLERDFGSVDRFKQAFASEAVAHFGSGWVWLCEAEDGALRVVSTHDGTYPGVNLSMRPLITLDVWEHAYYVDYRNRRAKFVDSFLSHLIDWRAIETRLTS